MNPCKNWPKAGICVILVWRVEVNSVFLFVQNILHRAILILAAKYVPNMLLNAHHKNHSRQCRGDFELNCSIGQLFMSESDTRE